MLSFLSSPLSCVYYVLKISLYRHPGLKIGDNSKKIENRCMKLSKLVRLILSTTDLLQFELMHDVLSS